MMIAALFSRGNLALGDEPLTNHTMNGTVDTSESACRQLVELLRNLHSLRHKLRAVHGTMQPMAESLTSIRALGLC